MNEPVSPNPDAAPEPAADHGMGHNNPPAYDAEALAELDADARQFVDASNEWLNVEVTTETLAGQLADQISGLRKLFKRIEAERTKEKAPHLERGKAVDAAFAPIKALVEKSATALKPKLEKYMAYKEKAAEEERSRLAEEARRAEEEARQKEAEAQSAGNIEAQVEAEEAAKKAEALSKAADKPVDANVKSASGAGRTIATRKRKACTIKNVRHLFMHYQDRQDVHDLLLRLANAEANAKDFPENGKIPGVEIEIKTSIS